MGLSTYVRVRCTEEEKSAWEDAAGDVPLSKWIRRVLNERNTVRIAKRPPQASASSLPSRSDCPRAQLHRPGIYCKSCGTV